MGNVWKAMKKHEQEGEADQQADASGQGRQDPSSPQAPDSAETGRARAKGGKSHRQSTSKSSPVGGAAYLASSGRDNGYSPLLMPHSRRGSRITEEYRSLRTSLLAQKSDERLCMLLTSADPGEGKTITTVNLGLVLAEKVERTTVLVDFDLRRGRIADLLNSPGSPGVAEYLRGDAGLEDVVQPTVYPNLFAIACGNAEAEDVGELAGRPELGMLISELRQRYDFVLFDTPPVIGTPDAGMLGGGISEALLVIRMNKTKRESVNQAIRLLHAASISVSGVVLTHRRFHIPRYGYRYKYY